MPLDSTSAAVIGAILGPTVGLIGTKLKDMAEKRECDSHPSVDST